MLARVYQRNKSSIPLDRDRTRSHCHGEESYIITIVLLFKKEIIALVSYF